MYNLYKSSMDAYTKENTTIDTKNKLGIWLMKRDFRLFDNTALTKAFEECEQVLAVFCMEPLLYTHAEFSHFHYDAIRTATEYLNKQIVQKGGQVLYIHRNIPDALEYLHKRVPFEAIYAHEETGLAHTYERDKQMIGWCKNTNVDLYEFPNNGVKRVLADRDARMDFWNEQVRNADMLPVPMQNWYKKGKVDALSGRYFFTDLSDGPAHKKFNLPAKGYQKCSEALGLHTLRDFLDKRGLRYRGGISSMNTATQFGSRLSIHLAWGTVSLRTVYKSLKTKQAELEDELKSQLPYDRERDIKKHLVSLRAFKARLYWHSHFIQRLEDEPDLEYRMINPAFEIVKYVKGKKAKERVRRWLTGTTGYPMIDASMRCFVQTGFLNFRSRAMITSFASVGLELDWRDYVNEMAALMADYVPGIHIPQVQMQSGVTGINTIRVYSPHKQIKDKDPDCVFIKKWIPELAKYSPKEIIAHSEGKVELESYCKRVVDFKVTSKNIKDQLYAIKKDLKTQEMSNAVFLKHGSRFTKEQRFW